MSLRLITLGGAAAWPNPGQGCSSYLVQSGATSLLLDCGSDTLLELRRHVDFTRIDAIVISHCHSDHILDLVPYRYGLLYGVRDAHGARPIPVWLPPGGLKSLDRLGEAFSGQGEQFEMFWDDAFELSEYDPDTSLPIGDLDLTFARTQHPIPCYAIRVDGPDGRSIAYASDTGNIEPLIEPLRGAGVLIAEATQERHDKPLSERVHLTPEDAGELATRAGAHTLVVTHLWSGRPDSVVTGAAAERFQGRIVVARPGESVDV